MRYLVLSDIHANLAAFEAVLEDAGEFDQIWCLGDVVGYGPDPNECIERLREFPHLCVAGNHDWACIGKLDIFDFNFDAQQACRWTHERLTAASREYLENLPTVIVQGEFTLVHGSPRHPVWEYVLSPLIARVNFAHFETPFCLLGHTHAPVIFRLVAEDVCEPLLPPLNEPFPLGDQRLIINPGGVGQPRDGDPRASYALLDIEAMTMEFRRVEYPIHVTQAKMIKAGLPPRLIARLSYGW